MGVDARILIKITNPKSHLDAKQLRQLSAQLSNVIGHEHFFLRPEDNRHAISFVIDNNGEYPDEYEEIHGVPFDPNGPANFGQDSAEDPDIVAEPNEQFLEVHVWSRYYGEHYARGDWKTLSWTLMWCFFNIKDCEVWYGGDSSGVLMEQMTPDRMTEMTKFYLTSGNDTYWANTKTIFKCEFCTCGVINSGGGGNIKYWHCDSCGSQWVTQNGTIGPALVTKYDPRGEDYNLLQNAMVSFKISEQISAGTRKMHPFDGKFRIKYPVSAAETQKQLGAKALQLEAGGADPYTDSPNLHEEDFDEEIGPD